MTMQEMGQPINFELPRISFIYRTSQNFATEKFRELLPKRGGRNIRDKNIREGGSDTLRNTITWLLCLCGSLDL